MTIQDYRTIEDRWHYSGDLPATVDGESEFDAVWRAMLSEWRRRCAGNVHGTAEQHTHALAEAAVAASERWYDDD